MSDVFVSYKREDEARVARLVRALEDAGLPVWWDRGLPGGEQWRATIEAALDAANVVIVCWTRASVGPEGGFVRDEASRAPSPGGPSAEAPRSDLQRGLQTCPAIALRLLQRRHPGLPVDVEHP